MERPHFLAVGTPESDRCEREPTEAKLTVSINKLEKVYDNGMRAVSHKLSFEFPHKLEFRKSPPGRRAEPAPVRVADYGSARAQWRRQDDDHVSYRTLPNRKLTDFLAGRCCAASSRPLAARRWCTVAI